VTDECEKMDDVGPAHYMWRR